MAGLHSLVVAGSLVVIAYLMVDAVFGRRDLDPVVRAGLVLPALLGGSLLLMLIHIASGGWFFAHPGAVRATTAIGAIALTYLSVIRGRRFHGRFPTTAGLALLGMLAVALLVWGAIVFEVLPARRGDTNLHTAWAMNLLNGQRLPTNALTGDIPNDYPWLFHALTAWVTTLTPGGRAYHALGPLQLLQVTGAVTGLFGLGYCLWRSALGGASTALLGSLTGGFGFLTDDPRLIYKVRGALSEVGSTWGDLIARRSYNASFHNLAPVYPREVSYALVPVLILLFVVALRTRDRLYLIAAGFLIGVIGLSGGEALIAGAAVTAAFVVFAGSLGRIRSALYVGVPATLVYALWLVPIVINYQKYGGFISLAVDPVELTPLQVIGGWGIVTPLAALGIGLLIPKIRWDPAARIVLLYVGTLGGLLLAVLVIGSGLRPSFETLGRAHRYWPLLFQAAAIAAGFGLTWLLERTARSSRVAAVAMAFVVVSVALISPLIGTRDLPEALPENRMLSAVLRGDRHTWLTALAPEPGERCVVAVPRGKSVLTFAYSGYRHVWYVWTRAHRNSARVRWRDIYSYIPTDAERREANDILTSATAPKHRYDEIVRRYGVDRVLVEGKAIDSPALAGYKIDEVYSENKRFGVVHTGDCEGA